MIAPSLRARYKANWRTVDGRRRRPLLNSAVLLGLNITASSRRLPGAPPSEVFPQIADFDFHSCDALLKSEFDRVRIVPSGAGLLRRGRGCEHVRNAFEQAHRRVCR